MQGFRISSLLISGVLCIALNLEIVKVVLYYSDNIDIVPIGCYTNYRLESLLYITVMHLMSTM